MIISSEMNIQSMMKLIDYQNNFSGGLITPEINIEPNGTCSLSWYGERGSLIIAFPFDKEEVEFSYIGINADTDFGSFAYDDRDMFNSLIKRAGVESLIKTQIFEKGFYRNKRKR
jgi:hypothetical protein